MSARAAAGARAAYLRGILAATALGLTFGPLLVACSTSPRTDARVLAPNTSGLAANTRPPHTLLDFANHLRARGCGARGGAAPPLPRLSQLDAAAQRLTNGDTLEQSTAAVGYLAMSSVSLEITGDLSNAAVERTLASRFCAQLTDPALRDIGIYEQGNRLWMLAAAPFAVPELVDPRRVAEQVNHLLNRARAAGRRCGRRYFQAVPALKPSARLREAALAHSRDMATHSYLEHAGRDGSTPGDRVTRSGYVWRAVGENIAAGPTSARAAIDGWLASPEHCANIMDPDFSDTAVAYAVNPRSLKGVYWTQEFAAPQQKQSRHGTSSRSGRFNH